MFYSRLFESLCSTDSSKEFLCGLYPPCDDDDDDDEGRSGLSSVASLAGSRTSSQWSLVKGGAADGDDDETVRETSFLLLLASKIWQNHIGFKVNFSLFFERELKREVFINVSFFSDEKTKQNKILFFDPL